MAGGAYRRLRHKHFQNITPDQNSPADSIEKYLWDIDQTNTGQDSRLDGHDTRLTNAELDLKAPIDSPVFTGVPEVTDPALNDYSVPMQASPVRDRLCLHDFAAKTSGGYLRALDDGGAEPYDRRIDRTEGGVIEARLNRLLDALPEIKILRELDVKDDGDDCFERASWIPFE